MGKVRHRSFARERGFTLLELTTVVTIVTLLATIIAVAASGATTSAKSSAKDGDLKDVETAVSRYEGDNTGSLPITESSTPTTGLADTNGDGVIRIKLDSGAVNPADFSVTEDVTCGSGSGTIAAAIDTCFGTIDFAGALVPGYLRGLPKHAADVISFTIANSTTAPDFTVTGADLKGNTIEVFSDAAVTSTDGLKAWNVDKDHNIFVLVADDSY
jgi:prepilin-type N-terminal cleavage/methylation domain-containing protein